MEEKLWIEYAMKNRDIQNYSYTIENSGKNGFVSTIRYAKIKGENSQGDKVTYSLVLKYSNITGEQIFPKALMSEAEVLMYTKISTEFKKMQSTTSKKFTAFPKCHGSLLKEHHSLIILDDLRAFGYELWPRQKPLTMDHTRLVLNEYGKFHALSFALKGQKQELFEEIVIKKVTNPWAKFAINSNYYKALNKILKYAKDLVRGEVEEELLDKLGYLEEKMEYIVTEMYKEEPEFSVITHMDGWNNNFMFKYQENKVGIKKLKDVKILDWQCTSFASPCFDLAFFLFTTSGTAQYENFEELLEVYYKSLSTFLRELGSDPQKLYPRSKFIEQWKKISKFGFVLALIFIKIIWLTPEEDLPDLDKVTINDPNREDIFDVPLREERVGEYKKYLVHLFKYYLNLDYLNL